MTAPDPFLRAHQIGPRTFSIGGSVYPISIRDQMVRGWMVVDRALRQGLLKRGVPDPPLVVVGAGAAGVTAAIRAAMQGVTTLLVEKGSQPFTVQKKCFSRWICPTQYDWPLDHYSSAKFPWSAEGGPLVGWTADRADALATRWHAQLVRAMADYPGSIQPMWDTSLVDEPQPAPHAEGDEVVLVRVRDKNASEDMNIGARMVLLAFGFGRERVFLEDQNGSPLPTRGIPFWATDPFASDSLGGVEAPRVLISGAGDGALQDFLRIVTKCPISGQMYARYVYEHCQLPEWVGARLRGAQDNAIRLYGWGRNNHDDHGALVAIESVHKAIIDNVFSDDDLAGRVRAKLKEILRDELPEIRMVYQCSHFSNCYGLNRFVVLLIAKHLEELGRKVLYPGRRVRRISGMHGHTCQSIAYLPDTPDDRRACHGCLHKVALYEYPDCRVGREDGWGKKVPRDYEANVLILRNGIILDERERRLSPPLARQLLPLDLPCE